jgi:tetratricopeptide (TPR) repeat protein
MCKEWRESPIGCSRLFYNAERRARIARADGMPSRMLRCNIYMLQCNIIVAPARWSWVSVLAGRLHQPSPEKVVAIMKILSTVALTAALVLAAFSAQAGATASSQLLNRSAKAMMSEDWYTGSLASRKALGLPNLNTWETMAALNNLCIFQTKLGLFKEALVTCTKSVERGPDQWANYINRANLLAMTGDARGAKADYARAKELNPTSPDLRPSRLMKPVTPSFIALASSDAPSVQRADVGQ